MFTFAVTQNVEQLMEDNVINSTWNSVQYYSKNGENEKYMETIR